MALEKVFGCAESVSYCTDRWFRCTRSKKQSHCKLCNLVLMDIAKAFTRACRKSILWKAHFQANIHGNLLLWIHSFLKGRVQRVKADGEFSDWTANEHGVPEGGCISPLLYLLLNNDCVELVKCEISLYADDTIMWSEHFDSVPPFGLA